MFGGGLKTVGGMETVTQLQGFTLSTKFRLLLPGWPCKLRPDRKRSSRLGRHPRAASESRRVADSPQPRVATTSERVGLQSPDPGASGWPERRGASRPRVRPGSSGKATPSEGRPGAWEQRPPSREGNGASGRRAGSSPSGESSNRNSNRNSNKNSNSNNGDRSDGGGFSRGHREYGAQAREGDVVGGGAAGCAVWSLVRGADLGTWAQLVRKYGTSLGGTFAANALFRAAHFVDGSGELFAADSGRTRRLEPAAAAAHTLRAAALADADGGGAHVVPSDGHLTLTANSDAVALDPERAVPPIDSRTFSELVQQLLDSVTQAAVAGQLDAVRCCRLLWALAKLSGGGGGGGGGAAGGREGGSDAERTEALTGAAAPSPPMTMMNTGTADVAEGAGTSAPAGTGGAAAALPRDVMQRNGGRCAAALAAALLRGLSEGAPASPSEGALRDTHPPGRAGGVGSGGKGAILSSGASPPRAAGGGGEGNAPHGGDLSGRLLVMAMWGLARLSADEHVPYGTTGTPAGAPPRPPPPPQQQRRRCGGFVGEMGLSHLQLWDGLCGALRPRLGGLQARELSNAMWALGTVRHCNHPVFGELAAALQPHVEAAATAATAATAAREGSQSYRNRAPSGMERCNPQDVANAVWSLARAGPGGGGGAAGAEAADRLLRAAEAAVLQLLPQLRPQHVTSLLWSFVTLRYRPRRLVTPPQPQPPQQQLRQYPEGRSHDDRRGASPCSMYQLLRQRAWELQLFGRADEGMVAQVVWALAKEQLADGRLLAAAAQRLRVGAGRLTLREAAMAASAYRMARYVDAGLFSALLLRAGSLSRGELLGAPHADVSIALLLRGLAWAGHYDAAVYGRLCDALTAHLATIQPQPLALALWALAEAQHRQPGFLTAATTVATAIVGHFSSGELSCVALSLARLGVRDADFFSAAAVTLTALRGGRGGGGVVGGPTAADAAVATAAAKAAAAEAASRRPLQLEQQRSLWSRSSELVPGEAAPPYGEDEAHDEDEAFDDDDDDVDEEDEAEELDELEEGKEMQPGDAEEEEEAVEEVEEGEEEGKVGEGLFSGAPAAVRRQPRRSGRRYWLQRAQRALHSHRWRRIDLLNPHELSNVMAAFAISGNVDELLYYRAQIRTRRLLNASSVLRRDAAAAADVAAADRYADVVGGAGGMSSAAGGMSSAASAAALHRGDPVGGCDMSAATLAKLLWAFVAVGVQEPPLLCALAHRLRQQLRRLEPRDIAALAWALAVARLSDCEDLLDRAVHTASRHAAAFKPADLATVAWAAATAGRLNTGLMDAAARLVLGDVPGSGSRGGGPDRDAAAAAAAAPPPPLPGLKVISDVAWAHSALRLYNPRLLARAAELGERRLRAAAAAAATAAATAAAKAEAAPFAGAGEQPAEPVPWLPPDLELCHVVALLEAHATWAAAPMTRPTGVDDGVAAVDSSCSCYHDGLFRAAARVLLSRIDELISEEVVTLTWCCAAVLHALPPPPPPPPSRQPGGAKEVQQAADLGPSTGQGADAAGATAITDAGEDAVAAAEAVDCLSSGSSSSRRYPHPILVLLDRLSDLLAATPGDSFLRPELTQLAQAHAMSTEYGLTGTVAEGRAAAAQPAPTAASVPSASPPQGCTGPLVLPPPLLARLSEAWGAVPTARTRRLVVELCGALDELGFRDVRIDGRSEDGLVPVDVMAMGPPRPRTQQHHHHQRIPRVQRGGGETAAMPAAAVAAPAPHAAADQAVRYAFLIATSELRAVGQPQVFWGPLAVKVRLLRARGWRVVVVPTPPGALQGEGEGVRERERMGAASRRGYVREVLRGSLEALEEAGEAGSAMAA